MPPRAKARAAGELSVELPPLHPGQQAVWDSEARFKVVCCGRRWGKTHLGVLGCIVTGLRGGRAWWIGPTFAVAGVGWRLLKEMCRSIPEIDINETERRITFPGGGVVQVKTGDRPDLLRGESLDFVVFDEVADIKQECWYECIAPALMDRAGRALFIGTPRGQDNWFYDIWLYAEPHGPLWERWHAPTHANPFIPPDEIELMASGLHPIIYNQEILAEFVVEGGTIFQQAWERHYQLVGDQHVYEPQSVIVMQHEEHIYETATLKSCIRFATCDLAASVRTSADYTVVASWALTPGKRLALLDFERRRMEGPDLIPSMQQARGRWRLAYVGIEKSSFQLSIVQGARKTGMPVRELTPDRDKVARAYTAAAHMQGGRVWYRKTIPDMQAFAIEVRNFPLATHDDCVDTLSYAADHIDRAGSGPQIVAW